MRGTRVCGYGRNGQHRNSGQRGGVGLYTGKTRQMKSRWIMEKLAGFPDPRWMIGKHGFHQNPTVQRLKAANPINIKDLELSLDGWVAESKAQKKGDTYIVNLADVDFQKLLGKGTITKKLEVTVEMATEKIVEKFKEAKCKLTVTKVADD